MKLYKTIAHSILGTTIILMLAACDSSTQQTTVKENSPVQSQSTEQPQNTALPEATAQVQVAQQVKYDELDTPLSVSTGDKIEVTELFWYGCGHCYALEPFVKNWLVDKPNNAQFVKVPAIFSQGWAFHGQAYYTMEILGVLEQANDSFFDQIHKLRKPINDLPALVEFLSAYNKTEEEVTAAFNSFAVNTKLNNAIKLTKESTATGVPSILVDGKYITGVSKAGGQTELFDIVNELVKKAASER